MVSALHMEPEDHERHGAQQGGAGDEPGVGEKSCGWEQSKKYTLCVCIVHQPGGLRAVEGAGVQTALVSPPRGSD